MRTMIFSAELRNGSSPGLMRSGPEGINRRPERLIGHLRQVASAAGQQGRDRALEGRAISCRERHRHVDGVMDDDQLAR